MSEADRALAVHSPAHAHGNFDNLEFGPVEQKSDFRALGSLRDTSELRDARMTFWLDGPEPAGAIGDFEAAEEVDPGAEDFDAGHSRQRRHESGRFKKAGADNEVGIVVDQPR